MRGVCRSIARGAVFAALLLLSGCTSFREYVGNGFKVGPDYRKPAAPVATTWIDEQDERVRRDPTDLREWWTVYNDPALNQLVQQAHAQNLSVRIAGLRILEAQAARGIAVGGLFPQTQQAIALYQRNMISKASPITSFFPFRAQDFWQFGGSMAWELDFWGRFRRQIESAEADLDASIENYDDVLVLLLSQVADNYMQLRTAEQRLKYARQNAEIQRGILHIAEERVRAGVANELDVTQARSNLARTEAAIPEFEVNRRLANNQLCILLGMPPQDLSGTLGQDTPIPSTPAEVVVGIPAEMLLRRPDVRRAEREAAAQAAQIGVAVADLYPHLSINGNININARDFPRVFTGQAWAGSVGPSFGWNVLNYGRLSNNVLLQDARFQELAVNYQNTVLQANAEAENALVTFLRTQEQVAYLKVGVAAAERSVEIVTIQYKAGSVDFNRVFNLQALLTQEQDRMVLAESAVARGLVLLYKSLGGGWQIRLDNPAMVMVDQPISTDVDEAPLPPGEKTPRLEQLPPVDNQPRKPADLEKQS